MAEARETAPVAADSQSVQLEVPARPGYVLLARLALSAVCRLTSLDDEDVADLKLATSEAANGFVGEEDEPAGPLQPVPDPGSEHELRFTFTLAPSQLVLEVACDGGFRLPADERELSRAIIDATVDDCTATETSMRLVKHLEPRGQ